MSSEGQRYASAGTGTGHGRYGRKIRTEKIEQTALAHIRRAEYRKTYPSAYDLASPIV